MKKYYLFKIKEEYNKDDLFELFSSIRRSSINNIGTAFSFYDSITDTISINEKRDICRYLKNCGNYQYSNNRYKYFDYYNNEKTIVEFHNNYMCIKTNKDNSNVLAYISSMAKYYLCDFNGSRGLFLDKETLF